MTLLPPSDLNEKKIRREVRSEPEKDWNSLIAEILTGEHHEWNEREDAFPHSLGWLFQYSREKARKGAFRSHINDGRKHEGSFLTTQIFTPRWLADRICEVAIPASDFTIHDPAAGAGQFLLAAYETLKKKGASPENAARQISGSDLDEEVLDVARYTLKRAFERDGISAEPKLSRADLLTQNWVADLTITNPPFLGRRSMEEKLLEQIDLHRPFHFDLFAATFHRALEMKSPRIAFVAPQSFWFIERFREARNILLSAYQLSHFFLLGNSTFQGLSGAKSASAAFVLIPKSSVEEPTLFYDLRTMKAEEKNAKAKQEGVSKLVSDITKVPGEGLSFFLNRSLVECFTKMKALGNFVEIPGGGNKTANNKKYLRKISELAPSEIRRVEGIPSTGDNSQTWVVYAKGGKFAPYWGNWEYAIDWSEEAQNFYAKNRSSNLLAQRYRFRPGLTYSDLSSVGLGVRKLPAGTLFDMTGPSIFVDDDDEDFLSGLMVILNSSAVREIVNALNPTLHIQVSDIRRVPIPIDRVYEFAEAGRKLVEFIQKLSREECESRDTLLAAFLEYECEIDRRVSALYGYDSTKNKRLKHHKI